jgi:hypothetical protein
MVASVLFRSAEIACEYRRQGQAAGIAVAKRKSMDRGRRRGMIKAPPTRALALYVRGLKVVKIPYALDVSLRTIVRYLAEAWEPPTSGEKRLCKAEGGVCGRNCPGSRRSWPRTGLILSLSYCCQMPARQEGVGPTRASCGLSADRHMRAAAADGCPDHLTMAGGPPHLASRHREAARRVTACP